MIRTQGGSDYNTGNDNSPGHSMVLLYYNSNYVYVVDGNNNSGKNTLWKMTWAQWTKNEFTDKSGDRKIKYVVTVSDTKFNNTYNDRYSVVSDENKYYTTNGIELDPSANGLGYNAVPLYGGGSYVLTYNIPYQSSTTKDKHVFSMFHVTQIVKNTNDELWGKLEDGYFYPMDQLDFQYEEAEVQTGFYKAKINTQWGKAPFDAKGKGTDIAENEEVLVVRAVKNKYDNIWYELNEKGSGQWVYSGHFEFVRTPPAEITISGANYPTGNIPQGKGFSLRGRISSNETITSVVATMYNANTGAVLSPSTFKTYKTNPVTLTPNANSVEIGSSAIDNKFTIGDLPNGAYRYEVVATTTSNTSKTVIDSIFTVGSGTINPTPTTTPTPTPTPEPTNPSDVSITISSPNYPTGNIPKGKGFDLRGTISANETIKTVKATMYNANTGAILAPSTFKTYKTNPIILSPNATSLNIRSSDINTKFTIGDLTDGAYRYEVIVTTLSDVTKTVIDTTFTVGSGTMPSPTPAPTIKVNSISVYYHDICLDEGMAFGPSFIGDTFGLTPVIEPSDSTDKSVSWTSSNTNVATIDADGNMTVQDVGKTTITCTANDGSGVSVSFEILQLGSGTCGDSTEWFLYDDYLRISGTGPMNNYTSISDRPWANYINNIRTIEVEDGVTAIGDYAFNDCFNVTSVSIPASVSSIGNMAFSNDTGLINVYFDATEAEWDAISIEENNDSLITATLHAIVIDTAVAPTCTETGLTEGRHCSGCDKVYAVQQVIDALGHDIVQYEAKTAACTVVGWDAYEACTRCEYTTYVEQPALGHDIVQHEAKAATCTEIGWDAYETCTRCDYTTYVEKPALGHDIKQHEAKAATCTTIGWDAYETCSRCDYTTYVEKPALGHDIKQHEAKAATCTEIGWDAYETCTRCDYTTYVEKPALGHDLKQHSAKAATCTAIGWDAYETCTRCDYTTYVEKPVLGHDLKQHTAKAATCTTIGWDAYETCTRCDYTTYVEKPALGHDLKQHTAKAATCTTIGWDAYETCTRCDYTTYVEKPASGHDLKQHTAKAATCTEIGWDAYETCTRCDYTTYIEKPALGHDLKQHTAKAATCTAIGWDAYETCTRCDYTTYVDKPALGHDIKQHEAKAATCTAIGWDAYETCTRCDYTTYVEKPALGHGIKQHEAKAATCTAVGWDAYETCTRCDYTTYAEKPALGHDIKQHEAKAATCTAIGWDAYEACSRCDYTTYVEIAKLDHQYAIDEYVSATCESTGLSSGVHCSSCGTVFLAQSVIPALGHDWKPVEYKWSADHTSVTAIRTCKRDASHAETETVDATVIIVSPSEDVIGNAMCISKEFKNEVFAIQTKTIVIPALKDMKVLRLPNMLHTIDAEAFANLACEAIIIPEGCTMIGEYAFAECSNLRYVRIPASVKSYPANAFDGCNENLIIDWAKE